MTEDLFRCHIVDLAVSAERSGGVALPVGIMASKGDFLKFKTASFGFILQLLMAAECFMPISRLSMSIASRHSQRW
ncbi:hypothetical protein HMPREF3227_02042 [Corynebacterium sp. CMW7794]|nr:hypothetical protein HMPREF0307_02385 [Corynebacterium sp. DNF00584]KXI16366.1 hypothetical protein HMPREF3227_02042 [Corynebacterium sp. CMW7794]